MIRFLPRLLCAASLAWCVGCGDDSAPPPTPRDTGPDTGRDASVDAPGGEDAPPTDGMTLDAPDEDGGMIMPGECGTTPEDVFTLLEGTRFRDRRVALAPAPSGAIAGWVGEPDGFDDFFARMIPSSGALGAEIAVTDHFAMVRGASLVPHPAGGFLAAWSDNDGAPFQVVTRRLGADGAPMGGANRITPVAEGVIHDTPFLAPGPSGLLAGFIEDDTMGGRVGATMALDDAGASAAALTVVTAGPIAEMRMVGLPDGAGAVFMRPVVDEQHVFFQPLDQNGRVSGALERIDNGGNAIGVVDAATGPGGDVGVAFDVDLAGGGVRTEVHFRRVDGETGAAVGLEAILTGANRGRDPGVTSLAGGFAVAYRALDGEGDGYPKIRVAFVSTSTGEVVDELDLDSTTEAGGPVTITTGLDGTLVVGWAEEGESGTSVRARRIRCGG